MDEKEREIRLVECEFRIADAEKREIEGTAIFFSRWSPVRYNEFKEMVLPQAVEGVIENSDIKFLYNHDSSRGFLARNNKGKGTLKIEVTDEGVKFRFKCKKDNLSNYIWERLESGELDETSFAFTIAEDEWRKTEDGTWERTIKKFDKLFDFSIVDQSFYGVENAVKCKRFAEVQEEDRKAIEKAQEEERLQKEKEEQEKREQEEAEKQKALDDYYKKVREDNAKYLK